MSDPDPFTPADLLAAWAERWHVTPDQLVELARQFLDAVKFSEAVEYIQPGLRPSLLGEAGAELLAILERLLS